MRNYYQTPFSDSLNIFTKPFSHRFSEVQEGSTVSVAALFKYWEAQSLPPTSSSAVQGTAMRPWSNLSSLVLAPIAQEYPELSYRDKCLLKLALLPEEMRVSCGIKSKPDFFIANSQTKSCFS